MSADDRGEDVSQWHLARNGRTYGPYQFSTLVEAAAKGVVSCGDKVWRPGWESWRAAETVPGLLSSDGRDNAPAPESKRETLLDDASDGAPVTEPQSEQAKPQTKRGNYFVRHWRGELSLPVSYWVNGILTLIAAYAASFAFTAVVRGGYARAGVPIIAALVCFLIVLLGLSTWQMVGIWRSATRHAATGRRFWAIAAKVMVVIGCLRLVGELTVSFVPVISEHVRIAMGDQRFGESRFRPLRDGSELEFSGGINVGAAGELARMLEAAPQVRVLHLNSHGGRIAEADLMAAEVRKRRLITYVAERCESACTHVFLAGSERLVGERAIIGFHQPSFPGTTREGSANLIAEERRRLKAAGLPDDFIDKAMAAPSDQMWRPTRQELLAARVISGVADGSRFAASGRVASSSPAELERTVLKIPLYASLQRVDPRAFDEIMAQLVDGYRRGVSEDEIILMARKVLSKVVRQQLPYAPDADVLQSVDVLIGYMDGLRSADPETCAAIEDPARGARLKADLTKLFPAIASKELALNQSIIESRASERRALPTAADMEPYLAKVADRLTRRRELRLELIEKPKLTAEEFKPFCEAVLAFYQEVRRLPQQEAVTVLRVIFTDSGK